MLFSMLLIQVYHKSHELDLRGLGSKWTSRYYWASSTNIFSAFKALRRSFEGFGVKVDLKILLGVKHKYFFAEKIFVL
jgi:hypothetical protein